MRATSHLGAVRAVDLAEGEALADLALVNSLRPNRTPLQQFTAEDRIRAEAAAGIAGGLGLSDKVVIPNGAPASNRLPPDAAAEWAAGSKGFAAQQQRLQVESAQDAKARLDKRLQYEEMDRLHELGALQVVIPEMITFMAMGEHNRFTFVLDDDDHTFSPRSGAQSSFR